jgi:hypothetical protein
MAWLNLGFKSPWLQFCRSIVLVWGRQTVEDAVEYRSLSSRHIALLLKKDKQAALEEKRTE